MTENGNPNEKRKISLQLEELNKEEPISTQWNTVKPVRRLVKSAQWNAQPNTILKQKFLYIEKYTI